MVECRQSGGSFESSLIKCVWNLREDHIRHTNEVNGNGGACVLGFG